MCNARLQFYWEIILDESRIPETLWTTEVMIPSFARQITTQWGKHRLTGAIHAISLALHEWSTQNFPETKYKRPLAFHGWNTQKVYKANSKASPERQTLHMLIFFNKKKSFWEDHVTKEIPRWDRSPISLLPNIKTEIIPHHSRKLTGNNSNGCR